MCDHFFAPDERIDHEKSLQNGNYHIQEIDNPFLQNVNMRIDGLRMHHNVAIAM